MIPWWTLELFLIRISEPLDIYNDIFRLRKCTNDFIYGEFFIFIELLYFNISTL